MNYHIELFDKEFQPFEELKKHQTITPNIGAQSVFVGYMRDFREDNSVNHMHISHYSPMTENVMTRLVEKAINDFKLTHVYLAHRVGNVTPTSPLVIISTTAEHRANAIQACERLLEALKHNVPLWKKEQLANDKNTAHWVDANSENKIH